MNSLVINRICTNVNIQVNHTQFIGASCDQTFTEKKTKNINAMSPPERKRHKTKTELSSVYPKPLRKISALLTALQIIYADLSFRVHCNRQPRLAIDIPFIEVYVLLRTGIDNFNIHTLALARSDGGGDDD